MEGREEKTCVGCNAIAAIGFPFLFLHKTPYAVSFPLILSCVIGGL